MCPVCLGSVAWLITGGVSVLGGTAGSAAIVRDRKFANGVKRIWKAAGSRHNGAAGPLQVQALQERNHTCKETEKQICKDTTISVG